MGTASTKSHNRKKNRRAEVAPAKPTPPEVARLPQARELSDRTWLLCSLFIMAVGAILRLYNLSLVPFHHDEGVNGNFLVRLVREGFYRYDPANYHGPTLYYFSAVIPWILRFLLGESAQNKYGLNTVTVRLVPALFGLGTIWLVLLLRRRVGTVGTLCAAALLAVSPGAVYLSRYFIHETLFVFFTLGVVVAGLKYYEVGNPVYLMLASVSVALLFATKETAIISIAVLVIALASTWLYLRLWNTIFREGQINRKQRRSQRGRRTGPQTRALERLGGAKKLTLLGLVALLVFVAVNLLFYSSFFTNYPKGVYDAVKTFEFWTKTGKEMHGHPITTYVWWLLRQEPPLIFLGTVGAALIVWKPRNSFTLFSALWAFGLLAAYSLISYKTPWLVLNFVVPLALISGYALQVIYDWGLGEIRLIIAVMLLAVAISGYKTVDLNFFNYDNDAQSYVYVYAHTRREMLALCDEIEKIAERTKRGTKTGVTIVSPDYWPLPWYLRDYTGVGYHGRMTSSTEPVIIASESQGAEVQATFGDLYQQVNSGFNSAGSYPLRPGVNLLLYVRRDALGPRP
ncbi:MAG: TIGR03663 family protein [Pyrinomonadaceae bacterium]|nr:TIGR03663 family protein [Pyrinomonadaceae bacterium]